MTVAIVGPGALGQVLARSFKGALLVGRKDHPRVQSDAVFLCVKSKDFPAALKKAKALAGPETPVVSLLNGLDHAKALSRAFGKRAVVGVSLIAALRPERGPAKHMGGKTFLLAAAPLADKAADFLRKAGWDVALAPSAERLLWTKMIFNAASNPLGALTRKSNGDLARIPALREILLKAVAEGQAVARAAGVRPLYPDLGRRVLAGLLAAPEQKNSMLQDLERGRLTEADAIVKPLLDHARRRRVAAPVLASLYGMVKRLETELK